MLDKGINEVTREEWVELYCTQRKTLTFLALNYKVNITTIANKMSKLGVGRRSEGRPLEKVIVEEDLVNLYVESGKSLSYIASKLDCTDKTVKLNLKKYGIPLRKKASEVLTEEYLSCRLDRGMSVSAIIKESGFSKPMVYKYLYKFDIKNKDTKDPIYTRIKEKYLSGSTTTEISEEIGKSTGFINVALAAMKVEINRVPHNKKIDYDEAAELYSEGLSLQEIAKHFGGGSKTLLKEHLEERGVVIRNKSEAVMGIKNSMYGKKHTKSTKTKMSLAYSKGVREISGGSWGHITSLETPYQGQVETRSSWEAAVGRYLNYNNISYTYENFKIKVEIDGIVRSYTPDFNVLDSRGKIIRHIEVKGRKTKMSMSKLEHARKMMHRIELWDIKVLKDMGIISCNCEPLY